jgi:diguanylate cyclase (GGDEF)-like protein
MEAWSESPVRADTAPGGAAGRRSAWLPRLDQGQLPWQLAAAVLVVAYGVSTFVVKRPPDGYSSVWDGWIYNTASLLPIVPVLLRVRHRPSLRLAWIAVAVGIALNAAGNLLYLFYDQNLHPIPNPASSSIPYLLSYVGFIVGVAMITQRSFGRLFSSIRLDGAIAGLTVAAVAAALWFDPVLKVSGRPLQVAVGMAFPLLDLVLLILLVAGLAPQRYRPTWPVGLLMVGFVWFVVGDVIFLNQSAANSYVQGTPLDETWILGIFLMGLAAGMRDDRRSRARQRPVESSTGVELVPLVFGLVSVGVLAYSRFHHVPTVASTLAMTALVLVILRTYLTFRELRQAAENFRAARTDELTGLPNRRAFQEAVESKFRTVGNDLRVGVLLIDLDGFKEVNDSLGHHAGDELLRVIAKRFHGQVDDLGSLARVGGDEFACAVAARSEDELVLLARELITSLTTTVALDGITVRVGASIGVAMSPQHGDTHDELLRCADVAMYEAKRTQSSVCRYSAEDDPNSRERLALIHELRTAIDERALTLHYQPTLDIHTAEVSGVEALVRWQHPTRGLLYPEHFIPLAERVGLIPLLTRAVLEQAVAEAARLAAAGHQLRMSVNISRYDLVDETLPAYIDRLLAQHGVPHDQMTLEITESCLSDDPERSKRSIEKLRAHGIRISIDDFGVGYSSMSQLLELPIDELKIDKSFVLALESDERAHAIISSAVELARALELVVVVEGVELPKTLPLLQRLGADVAQGYHISHPLTRNLLDEFLAETHHRHGLEPEAVRAVISPARISP